MFVTFTLSDRLLQNGCASTNYLRDTSGAIENWNASRFALNHKNVPFVQIRRLAEGV